MRVVLIDDEEDALETLRIILMKYCEGIEVVGSARSAIDGVKLIGSQRPDLIFLDVEMPDGNGFDVLEAIEHRDFKVIFTTAYNHYAVKAIKFNALDYLLKPIDIDELVGAVDNVSQDQIQHKALNDAFIRGRSENQMDKLPIFSNGAYHFKNLCDIYYLESDGAYTNIVCKENIFLSSKNLGHYTDVLVDKGFFRVGRKHLVNIQSVMSYESEDGGQLQMPDDKRIPVPKKSRVPLKTLLGI